jgi:hypothetical protein
VALVTVGRTRNDGEEISGEDALEYLGHQYDSRSAAKGADGVWRAGGAAGRDYGDPREQHESYRGWLVSAVPTGLTVVQQPSQEHKRLIDKINDSTAEVHFHARPLIRPNWREWAREAGLDKWEKRVLDYGLPEPPANMLWRHSRTKSLARRCRPPGNALTAMAWSGSARRRQK